MPEAATIQRARRDAQQGKSPSTQAGEFVREQIHHIREGKHGAASAKQAIAIGLSEARRAGVDLAPPAAGSASNKVRRQAARDLDKGRTGAKPSPARSRARVRALRKEGTRAASPLALSRQAGKSARKRGARARSAAARASARTRRRLAA